MSEPKNYRAIMLSSTFTDLSEHRQRAIEAISKLGYMPKVMEHTGARAGDDMIESSLNMVRDSTAYVGVISLKYGQTPFDPDRNPNRLSVTELEFNEAMRLKRPMLLFIMDKKHPLIEEDIELDQDKRQKLDAFRERAKRMREGEEVHRVYEAFKSLEQFSTTAAIAIGRLVQHLGSSDRDANEVLVPAQTHSNIPIHMPRHFLGRDEDFAAIEAALKSNNGRAAITALHGLRGVGKTTLAAAYANHHRDAYRATWWIRAETESTMRADLVGLGVRLEWVAADAAEEAALTVVMERLRHEGDGILLVYDNANNADEISPHVPHGGAVHIVVTSNAPNWRSIAEPVEIEVWQKEVGADYLVKRTGRDKERHAALALSEALGGLPLAHEQAAAYCERLGVSLAEYAERFAATPGKFLDDARAAPAQYHNGLTVAKTFALAIDEAAKLHPAAEPLIVYAALLAPEPIPLFLFSEYRARFVEPFASALAGDGLDEAVAALRTYALVDRETIADEREPSITTDCIRLHRLVRQVAGTRREGEALEKARRELIEMLAAIHPKGVHDDPKTWPRARRLDALILALVNNVPLNGSSGLLVSRLLMGLALYRMGPLAAYGLAGPLLERALVIGEKVLGPDHPNIATLLATLGFLLFSQGDLVRARRYYERSLAIREKVLGPDDPKIARGFNNLGGLLQKQGDLAGALSYYERALAIKEKVLGSDHPTTAASLNNLGGLLQEQGDLGGARSYFERALAISENVLGPDHPTTAACLNNIGLVLKLQGGLGARRYYERALARVRGFALENADFEIFLTAKYLICNGRGLRFQPKTAVVKTYPIPKRG